jgi:hypothetical protein
MLKNCKLPDMNCMVNGSGRLLREEDIAGGIPDFAESFGECENVLCGR